MPLPPPPLPAAIQLIAGADLWTTQGPQHGQAIVIQKGKILAVGAVETLTKSHPGAQRVDLPGGTLLPGFIEGHAHVGSLGALSHEVDLAGLESLPETLGRIREWSTVHTDGWLIGRGWDQNRWPAKAFPGARDLDTLTGARPAMLERVDGHAAWVNTAALAIAGIGPQTPDPEGGRILKDAQGRPNGILLDAAIHLVAKHIPSATDTELEARIQAGLLALQAEGFTAVADMGVDVRGLAAYRRLAKAGKTLSLEYCSTTAQTRVDTLKMIASQLKAIGIKVTANNVKSSVIFASWDQATDQTDCNLAHGTFDVAEFAYVSPLDPLGGYLVYTTVGIPDNPPHDGQNVTRISLPVLDSAYLSVLTNVDFSKVRDAMFTVQDIYGSDQNTYELPLYYRKDVWLVNPKLHNFTGNPTTSAAEWNIGDWWVG